MNIYKTVVGSLLMVSSLYAGTNNGFESEFGHFAGGVVMAGGITAVVDYYYPEYRPDRAMIGFGVSSAAIIIEQGVEIMLHGDAKGQILDAVCHVAGSALGAYITDKYILSPVIKDTALEGKYIGLVVQRSF